MKPILHNPISICSDRSRIKNQKVIIHFWLLLLWIVLGSMMRFFNLDGKTVWSDEWATIVFSLGHSFHSVPLDKIISLSTLLEPLRIDNSGAGDVVSHLMGESTHPPLYFVLSNWWLRIFSNNGDLVSLWLARSLSATFGVLAILAMFGLGWLSFNSLFVGQLAAGLMAVSPYGIYLAQETRHYTLVILWVIISLACWIVTIRCRSRQQIPRRSLMLVWIVVNSLGIATHYFFALNLLCQMLVLLTLWWQDVRANGRKFALATWFPSFWRRIGTAVLGTVAGCSAWVMSWQYFPDARLTEWTQQDPSWSWELLFPIGRLLTWILTMFVLPPVEGVSVWVTIASLVVLLPVVFWFIRAAWQYFYTASDPVERAIAFSVGTSLILNLVFAYVLGRDLTIAARFQYFYFPLVLILGAAILQKWKSKALVVAVLLSGCLGGVAVINNYGFQKSDRPDLVVPVIAEVNQLNQNIPIVIATVHKTHEQTGEMMGLAWEWQQRYSHDTNSSPEFLLLHVEENYRTVTSNLYRFLEQSSRPLDLWLVNFSASTILKYHSLKSQGCIVSPDYQLKVSGYRFNHYYCQEKPLDARKNYY